MHIKRMASIILVLGLFLNSNAISITELVKENRVPKLYSGFLGKTLDLSHLDLGSLEGLQELPSKDFAVLILEGNSNLESLPLEILSACPEVRYIFVGGTKIKMSDLEKIADEKPHIRIRKSSTHEKVRIALSSRV